MATINICDICGTRDNVAREFYATGNDNFGDLEGEYFDLCDNHRANCFEALVLRLRTEHMLDMYQINTKLITIIKSSIVNP